MKNNEEYRGSLRRDLNPINSRRHYLFYYLLANCVCTMRRSQEYVTYGSE